MAINDCWAQVLEFGECVYLLYYNYSQNYSATELYLLGLHLLGSIDQYFTKDDY